MGAPELGRKNPRNRLLRPIMGRRLFATGQSRDEGPEHAEHEHGFEWVELARIAFVALAAAAVWFRVWEPFPRISVIGIAATLIGGYPIFKEAIENIVERKMTMELSMTIALLAALAIREFFTASGHYRLRACRRGSGGPDRRSGAAGNPGPARFPPPNRPCAA